MKEESITLRQATNGAGPLPLTVSSTFFFNVEEAGSMLLGDVPGNFLPQALHLVEQVAEGTEPTDGLTD